MKRKVKPVPIKYVDDGAEIELPAPVEVDKELKRIVYRVVAWQKLPYAPNEVSVKDVVTPAQAMSDLLAWRDKCLVAELEKAKEFNRTFHGKVLDEILETYFDDRIAQLGAKDV